MIITNPSISSSVGAFLAPLIITARLFLYISTMHGTLSSLSSIMGAMAHYPLFRGLVEQLSVIAAKFGVCTMAPTHTSLQCIIEISWMDASFECHGTMEDTMKFSFFPLLGMDIFNTPSGFALNSLSTVTHAGVTNTHQISTYLLHDVDVAKHRTLAALTPNHLRPLTLTMTVALPSSYNLLGAPLVVTMSCLCTMRDTNTLVLGYAHASLHTACPSL
jgi:hypothetical protein